MVIGIREDTDDKEIKERLSSIINSYMYLTTQETVNREQIMGLMSNLIKLRDDIRKKSLSSVL
jgi:hypothetical protein